jgi:hypothetical protein
LRLVDGKTVLGMNGVEVSDWRVRGTVEVMPAYDSATIDAFFDPSTCCCFRQAGPRAMA